MNQISNTYDSINVVTHYCFIIFIFVSEYNLKTDIPLDTRQYYKLFIYIYVILFYFY